MRRAVRRRDALADELASASCCACATSRRSKASRSSATVSGEAAMRVRSIERFSSAR
jgi:hypothetical protein